MARSIKKGPFIDAKLEKKIAKIGKNGVIKTWSRRSVIMPEMIGITFAVHNGKDFINVKPSEDMVGHKLGEFSPSTKFHRHGGRCSATWKQSRQPAEPYRQPRRQRHRQEDQKNNFEIIKAWLLPRNYKT